MTIITFIPADLHFKTAKGTESFGGSINDIKPTNVKSSNLKLNFSFEDTLKGNPFG